MIIIKIIEIILNLLLLSEKRRRDVISVIILIFQVLRFFR